MLELYVIGVLHSYSLCLPVLPSWTPVVEINCIPTALSTHTHTHNKGLPGAGIRAKRLARTANLSGPHSLRE